MQIENLHKNIGSNLSRIRKERGLSLDQVSSLTQVSKGMLAQIEKGSSNPSISVLWKIANGLQVSFTSMLEADSTDVSIVSYETMAPLIAEDGSFRSYPIFPFDANTRIEMYIVEMDAGCTHPSEPHNKGVKEYVYLHEGMLTITINDSEYQLIAGQAMRFDAAAPHTYINHSNQTSRFHVTISYS